MSPIAVWDPLAALNSRLVTKGDQAFTAMWQNPVKPFKSLFLNSLFMYGFFLTDAVYCSSVAFTTTSLVSCIVWSDTLGPIITEWQEKHQHGNIRETLAVKQRCNRNQTCCFRFSDGPAAGPGHLSLCLLISAVHQSTSHRRPDCRKPVSRH